MIQRRSLGALIIIAMMTSPAYALNLGDTWVSISNLAEAQVGRDPTNFNEADDQTRFFNQLILDLNHRDLRLGLRAERFQDSVSSDNQYDEVTQRFVEFEMPNGSIRIGNGYATLGRGLLFRAFELPGVVRQVRFPTTAAYAESRDLDGVTAQWRRGPVRAIAIAGRPTMNLESLPGGNPPRRDGSVAGGHASVEIWRGAALGGGYLQVDGSDERGSVDLAIPFTRLAGVSLPIDITSYIEYAGAQWRPLDDGLNTETGTPHALYTATEIVYSTGGVSVETKDYHQFNHFINDPPSLVPEFSHKLLNRSTHFLNTVDEKGHQVAWFQHVPTPWLDLHVEATQAQATSRIMQSPMAFANRNQYRLAHLGVSTDPGRAWQAGVYGASDRDDFELIGRRNTVGATLAGPITGDLAFEIDAGHQAGERTFGAGKFDNLAITAVVSRAGTGQIGVEFESSNDPFVEDDPITPEVETEPRRWLSVVLAGNISSHHQVVVFAGQRRGGTACVSGTCYFVPDFEGVEARLVSRF